MGIVGCSLRGLRRFFGGAVFVCGVHMGVHLRCLAVRLAPSLVLLWACAALLSGCSGSATNQFELLQTEEKAGASVAPLGAEEGKAVRFPRAADAITSAGTPGSTAYKIGPADILDVSVFKVPELARTVLVDEAGAVNLPLVGDVTAAGKTA